MSLRLAFLAFGGFLSAAALAQPAPVAGQQWNMLQNYCTECHNFDDFYGGLAFDLMSPNDIPHDAEVWEKALRKLRGRLMPPPGSPQPEQAQIDDFMAWMEAKLDAEPLHPPVGHVPLQRLNRTEFALAVKDLLGVEIDGADYLPAEIEVDGFENIAAALSVSPAFLDQYIGAARAVARQAIGEPAPKLSNVYYPSPGGSQANFEDGMPLGSRGGMKVRHNFPADGEYRLNILDLDVGLYPRAVETRQTVIALVDGVEVFREDLGGEQDMILANRDGAEGRAQIMQRFSDIPFTAKAGNHDVVLTFIERSRAESDATVGRGGAGGARVARFLDGIEIVGPYNATGVSMTPSRARIFVCQPGSAAEELPCARDIIASLGHRAFRHELSEADIQDYLPFFEAGRQGAGGFDAGIEQVVAALLASPDFLYRGVSVDKDIGASRIFALNDTELATRLSFFLWGQGPDAALLDLAAARELGKPDVLRAEVQRMLRDPRAANLVNNFALRWLNLDDLDTVDPEPAQFPGFSDALRQDMATEVELFLSSIFLQERPVQELLNARHTFLNERLARHYGVNDVFGAQFRRVDLQDERRWGILGKGAVLLRTSYGDRTSPVLRGAWVLDKLMGTPPSPPPPDVVTDLSAPEGQKPTTVRARLEQHRVNPTCSQCHGVIDPIGLALENFSVTGQWRDRDAQADMPIDASTVLPNGHAINGPVALREELGSHPAQFAQALTEKLMMFAINRELEYFDMPEIRRIVQDAQAQDYTLSALVFGIVNSPTFRNQALPEGAEGQVAGITIPNENGR